MGDEVAGASGKDADGGSTRPDGTSSCGTIVAMHSGGEFECACGWSASGDERSGRPGPAVVTEAPAAFDALGVRLRSCGRDVQSSKCGPAGYEEAGGPTEPLRRPPSR